MLVRAKSYHGGQSYRRKSCLLYTSKVAEKYKMTNSLVVNALRKLESAGVLTSRSMGMKGTKIQINNLYLRDVLEEIR